ncbi:MAG TPA: hypothetical protein VFO94_17375, partial [Gammaproteobacteria bacterium]|nr:hypothetical protein [Gammaproteobacteria bacterium]
MSVRGTVAELEMAGGFAPRPSREGTKRGFGANNGRERPNPMPRDAQPSHDSEDACLLREVAAGVDAAFIALYRRRSDDVYRFALAMARSQSIAQDV